NDACILVRVLPGEASGTPAKVETVPDLGVFEIRSTATTVGSNQRQQISIRREIGSSQVEVSGQIRAGAEAVESWVTVEDPVGYLGAALRATFLEEGVEIPTPEAVAYLPRDHDRLWWVVARHTSDLLTTLEVLNKRSQNFYAESVLKTLGARACGKGSWAAGLQAVGEFLDRLGVEREEVSLADGSGMSRGNRATARQVTSLLRRMFYHRWGAEFLKTLPYSGEPDLHWQKRLADPPYRGNVFAKTGTLRGVSALSGYAKGRSGRLYAFSILLNDTRDQRAATRAQDTLIKTLIDHG
ncbi:MAG: D-alanyl-D-alanine carboxypeptidase/D-alanyl-D-alanine-endopeptidase, partial [Acidobacteria bacterium]|nr:D-alanyl-D-alanine carboxypeptidase/D-alanyl-D-alanine-endopeptidase [Acidobacteriota bacterium]